MYRVSPGTRGIAQDLSKKLKVEQYVAGDSAVFVPSDVVDRQLNYMSFRRNNWQYTLPIESIIVIEG